MKGFFDKIGKDVQKAFNSNSKNNHNNRGGGKSLGGVKPGTILPNITITQPGPIGITLENTSDNHSAIIAAVSKSSLAESAGLQRGDVVCYTGCNGEREYKYQDFLKLVKSNARPLVFDVRRTIGLAVGTGTGTGTGTISTKAGTQTRADADARRQAVIAAAEQRNSQHKAKTKPIPKFKGGKVPVLTSKNTSNTSDLTPEQIQKIENQKLQNIQNNLKNMNNEPKSEEAKKAVEAAKQDEIQHMHSLGYNPYEVRKVTAGQASSASIAMTHGAINASGVESGSASASASASASGNNVAPLSSTSIPLVQQPANAFIPAPDNTNSNQIDPSGAFDTALTEILTSNPTKKSNISKTLRILKKLITNVIATPATATSSSSSSSSPLSMDDPKRKIRITNPNNIIKECVVDMVGSIELLMSVGFVMMEDQDVTSDATNTCLFYGGYGSSNSNSNSNSDSNIDSDGDGLSSISWLKNALSKMEQFENEYK
jgi:hypothetical protein